MLLARFESYGYALYLVNRAERCVHIALDGEASSKDRRIFTRNVWRPVSKDGTDPRAGGRLSSSSPLIISMLKHFALPVFIPHWPYYTVQGRERYTGKTGNESRRSTECLAAAAYNGLS